jgi:uncharacterized protein YjbI with pentapeptide repeats
MPSPGQPGAFPPGGIFPSRAPVPPRVRILGETASLPLEDRISGLLQRGEKGLINLIGQPGSGKTTALQHLWAVFGPDAPLSLFDNLRDPQLHELSSTSLVVVASQQPIDPEQYLTLELARWTEEDLAAYLLATHPARCRAVMSRLLKDPDRPSEPGLPEVWRIALDEMAADDALPTFHLAISQFLDRELPESADRHAAGQTALITLSPWGAAGEDLHPHGVPRTERLMRHPVIQLNLAARHLVMRIESGSAEKYLWIRPPLDLIRHVAVLAAQSPQALAALDMMTRDEESGLHPSAVSILHAAGIGWRPAPRQVPNLRDAWLTGIEWDDIHLAGCNMSRADLAGASLANADLAAAVLEDAQLAGATLRNARLNSAKLLRANLSCVNLAAATADSADFGHCDLSGANLCGASLRGCLLRHANLAEARFCRADLSAADFSGARIEGADFSHANLSHASLPRLRLSSCVWDSTRLDEAQLPGCNLEGVVADEMDFRFAHLERALLTGSVFHAAHFAAANLRSCGLAEIDWEGADLRDADLRGATFHMGTTRSGLVGSTVPCEGSRTGFYTDEYYDTGYKNPEEIRKANLCGADLRDAKIDNVDFYLVDLRDARYSETQGEWFRKCGAILCDR